MKYLIYDLQHTNFEENFSSLKNDNLTLINASKPFAKCVGCFKCWLKNPGECVFNDDIKYIGSKFLSSDEIIIVCESVYGGLSINTKRIIDRVIPGVLPFFKKVNNELHHAKRYDNNTKITVYFYNSSALSDNEKQACTTAINAMGTNFHSKKTTITFLDTLDDTFYNTLMEAVK